MAKLEELFPHFPEDDEAGQDEFVRKYREKRAQDLAQVTEYAAKKKRENLSESEKALLKKLGISISKFKELKNSMSDAMPDVEPEEIESAEEETNDPGVFDSDDEL